MEETNGCAKSFCLFLFLQSDNIILQQIVSLKQDKEERCLKKMLKLLNTCALRAKLFSSPEGAYTDLYYKIL